MKSLLIEPFYSGSHRLWVDGLMANSTIDFTLLSLPGRHWKWRMHGGAVELAEKANNQQDDYDLIIVSDMLDLATFKALYRPTKAKFAVYFHENQLSYPWNPEAEDVKLNRDNHYAWINYTTALSADRVLFNSQFHKNQFLQCLPSFLQQFPDFQSTHNVNRIAQKSEVLHLGMNLSKFDEFALKEKNDAPILLWNHRWEYDKDPDTFFNALFQLQEEGIPFQLVVMGERYKHTPAIFEQAKAKLADRILHWGYAEDFETYARWLWKADILPVTSNQDFFGGSAVEAMYCHTIPLLPNWLAFTEYASEDSLYESGQFYNELRTRLLTWQSLKTQRDGVERFDWNRCITRYESLFHSIFLDRKL